MIAVPATTSGDLAVAAATVVTARPARVMMVVLTPAAALSTAVVFDNASAASGTVIARLQAAASAGSIVWTIPTGVVANQGLTVAVTGTGAIANVYYAAE